MNARGQKRRRSTGHEQQKQRHVMPVNVSLVLVPYDTARRDWGMGRGPEHLLSAGLVEALASVGHAVELSTVDAAGDDQAEVRTAFQLMTGIADAVRRAREANRFPLVLAGNCNTALGTVAGLDRGFDRDGAVARIAVRVVQAILEGTSHELAV